jgi:hypothetical protein
MIASSFLARTVSSSLVACRRGPRARWTPCGVGAVMAGKHNAEGVVLSSVGMWSSSLGEEDERTTGRKGEKVRLDADWMRDNMEWTSSETEKAVSSMFQEALTTCAAMKLHQAPWTRARLSDVSGTGMLGCSVVTVRCRFADEFGGANDERRGGRKPAAFLASMST